MKIVNASEFNRQYKIGAVFRYQPEQEILFILVKTLGPARDFKKSGTVVEINKAPYFVKATALIPV
ncbi:hypothetical protein [Serratia marcescens]|uniref:hypothetical protein n=1 Tax=Serratia marcescens TaxID=615 RepID=UPI0018688183|nr:hypothetical protein [Serratia marcescens]